MPDLAITKSSVVMRRLNTIDNITQFIYEFDDTKQIQRTVLLTTQDWEELGSPEELTVTIAPGDKLNEPAGD